MSNMKSVALNVLVSDVCAQTHRHNSRPKDIIFASVQSVHLDLADIMTLLSDKYSLIIPLYSCPDECYRMNFSRATAGPTIHKK